MYEILKVWLTKNQPISKTGFETVNTNLVASSSLTMFRLIRNKPNLTLQLKLLIVRFEYRSYFHQMKSGVYRPTAGVVNLRGLFAIT